MAKGGKSPSPSYSPWDFPGIIFPVTLLPSPPPIIPALTWFLPLGLLHVHQAHQAQCTSGPLHWPLHGPGILSLQLSHGQLATPGLSPPCSTTDMKQLPLHHHHPAQFLFLLITASFQLADLLAWLWSVPSHPLPFRSCPAASWGKGPPSGTFPSLSPAPRHRAQHEAGDQCL